MIQVSQSPLLQALGYAIINSIWQFALLWLFYYLISNILSFSSHQKYTAGITLQVAGFIWFIVTLIFYYFQCLQANEIMAQVVQTHPVGISASIAGESSGKEILISWLLKTEQFLPYLSIAYLYLPLSINSSASSNNRFTVDCAVKLG